jgi:hypothetical protein
MAKTKGAVVATGNARSGLEACIVTVLLVAAKPWCNGHFIIQDEKYQHHT